MSRIDERLHAVLCDLDRQWFEHEIDKATWEREVRLARADAAAERRQEEADMADAAHDFHGQAY